MAGSITHEREPPCKISNNLIYRLRKKQDDPALAVIDSSFTTDSVFTIRAAADGFGFTLVKERVDPPLTKHFPDDDESDDDESGSAPDPLDAPPTSKFAFTLVVEDPAYPSPTENSQVPPIVGFIGATYSAWNRRLVITDIEIHPDHRGQGIGTQLVNLAEEYAQQQLGTGHVKQLWLEVSNVNVPAIQRYMKMGFRVCGLDVSMYDSTPSQGEVAVFMTRKCMHV